MTADDYYDTGLCLYREARGEGDAGMAAVACVIRNRVHKRSTSYAIEVYRPWQFTSMTDKSDPEYHLYPTDTDSAWEHAKLIAQQVIDGVTSDVTGGATLYWAPQGIKSTKTFTLKDGRSVPFPPTWNTAVVRESAVIGHHVFLVEVN